MPKYCEDYAKQHLVDMIEGMSIEDKMTVASALPSELLTTELQHRIDVLSKAMVLIKAAVKDVPDYDKSEDKEPWKHEDFS